MLFFFQHQGTTGKLFACRFQITIDIEGIVKMNLIFCHSKKSAKIAENAQIPNFGSISTYQKYFFLQKKNFSHFLYIKNHWKNTGTFDFETFCNFQPYLGHLPLWLEMSSGSAPPMQWLSTVQWCPIIVQRYWNSVFIWHLHICTLTKWLVHTMVIRSLQKYWGQYLCKCWAQYY